jgi:LPXTG-motif cell wall-anchored protein
MLMKLFDKKRIIIIVVSLILGLIFAGYILFKQTGELGSTELIALGLTLIIAVSIIVIMIKKGNKE